MIKNHFPETPKAAPIVVNQSWLSDLNRKPVMVVGQWPGKVRYEDQALPFHVFSGNRTGDFVRGICEEFIDITLTNAHNWQRPRVDHSLQIFLDEGLKDLQSLVDQVKPVKIICLGAIATHQVDKLNLDSSVSVVSLRHPSFVLRFNLNVVEYSERLRYELSVAHRLRSTHEQV